MRAPTLSRENHTKAESLTWSEHASFCACGEDGAYASSSTSLSFSILIVLVLHPNSGKVRTGPTENDDGKEQDGRLPRAVFEALSCEFIT